MDRSSRDYQDDCNTSSDESDKVAPKDFMRSLPEGSGKRTRKARQVFDPSDNNIPRSKLAKRAYLLQGPQSQLPRPKVSKHDLLSSPTSGQKSSPEKTPQKDGQGSSTPLAGPSSPTSTHSSTPTKFEVGGCVICRKVVSTKAQRLVNCKMKNCDNQVHPFCLKNLQDPTLEAPMRHALKWRCMQCRKCTICTKKFDLKMGGIFPNEWMVVCHLCDETFHAQCHSPALVRKPVGKWVCYRCTVDKALSVGCNTVVYPDAPPLTIELPKEEVPPSVIEAENAAIPDEIGDVVDWSASDLATYFKDKGFEEEAKIMEEQEVDGKSLLLMSRLDVLKGLKLKLGPALRMYTNHVQPMKQLFFKVQ